MRGFTNKALINCCDFEHARFSYWDDGTYTETQEFSKAIRNVIDLLKENNITPYATADDAVARILAPESLKFVNILPRGDMFFLHRYSIGYENDVEIAGDFTEGRDTLAPIPEGISVEDRLNLIGTHRQTLYRLLAGHFKFNIVFDNVNVNKYPAKSAVWRIHPGHFSHEIWMGGNLVDLRTFLEIPYGNAPVNVWEEFK